MIQQFAVGLAIGAFVLPVAAAAEPAAPAEPAAVKPAVSVAIENSDAEVTENSKVTYRIIVRNDSATDYPNALIAQMLPDTLAFGKADPEPAKTTASGTTAQKSSEVQWIRHLPAHGQVTIDLTAEVGARPEKGTISTTACVLPDGVTRPLICDTDTDAVSTRSFPVGWLVTAGLGVLVVAGAVVWTKRRSGRGGSMRHA